MTTTPTLNGQVLGQAEHATRALLDRLLARTGTTFHGWVALNQTGASGDTIARAQLTERMVHGLKIDEATVRSTVDDLVSAGLLDVMPGPHPQVCLTAAGRTRYVEIRTAIEALTARLYGDLPAEDLATAGRVLTIVTGRANAELAAA
jgi:DNA-binding MarR family transcriptional regulator